MSKSRKTRPTRDITPQFKIFCEGDTEYNYFNELKKDLKYSIILKKPENMKGGGYATFLKLIRSDSDSNCIGKLIVVDGDKINSGEKKGFSELLEYCKNQNRPIGNKKSQRIPYILIVNYADFEYVACLHNAYYKGTGSTDKFITSVFGYKNVDEFKSDDKIYGLLTRNGKTQKDANTIDHMMEAVMRRPNIVSHVIKKSSKSSYDLQVEGPVYHENNVGIQSSNIQELFHTLDLFKK